MAYSRSKLGFLVLAAVGVACGTGEDSTRYEPGVAHPIARRPLAKPPDPGPPVDPGQPPQDAGQAPADAGQPPDAGPPPDAGQPQDAGRPCDPGFADCDGLAQTGCETPLDTPTDCGACGRACDPGLSCQNGACVDVAACAPCGTEANALSLCDANQPAPIGGRTSYGCEPFDFDRGGGGGTGAVSGAGGAGGGGGSGATSSTCRLGMCVPAIDAQGDPHPTADCNGAVVDGCETLVDADPNCGACGHDCQTLGLGNCASGRCTGESASCPAGLPGPALLDAGGFCVDRTEVTRGDYEAFLAAAPSPSFGVECAWKTGLSPAAGASTAHPAVAIDWCDADAYCRWAGKRLCGPRSAEPSTVETGGEWLSAYGGEGSFPYGAEYQPWRCNLADYPHADGIPKALPVSEPSSCAGAIGGLVNMSGNVAEWVDRCDGYLGSNDTCKTRGNSYADGEFATNENCWLTRDERRPTVGFRCCSDLAP